MKQKKAWILIVESVIAILILFGFLFTTIAKQSQQIQIADEGEFLYNIVNELAIKAIKSNEIRNAVLNNGDFVSLLEDELDNEKINLDALVCDMGESCTIDIEAEEIYTSEIIISSNSETYDPKKLKIFIW